MWVLQLFLSNIDGSCPKVSVMLSIYTVLYIIRIKHKKITLFLHIAWISLWCTIYVWAVSAAPSLWSSLYQRRRSVTKVQARSDLSWHGLIWWQLRVSASSSGDNWERRPVHKSKVTDGRNRQWVGGKERQLSAADKAQFHLVEHRSIW